MATITGTYRFDILPGWNKYYLDDIKPEQFYKKIQEVTVTCSGSVSLDGVSYLHNVYEGGSSWSTFVRFEQLSPYMCTKLTGDEYRGHYISGKDAKVAFDINGDGMPKGSIVNLHIAYKVVDIMPPITGTYRFNIQPGWKKYYLEDLQPETFYQKVQKVIVTCSGSVSLDGVSYLHNVYDNESSWSTFVRFEQLSPYMYKEMSGEEYRTHYIAGHNAKIAFDINGDGMPKGSIVNLHIEFK